ncbi:hypothetical protein LUZ63_017131 [Rhynchospora breviuscula]|uniref:Uncharacterized protein n=1 Tax=Rhynchospora breviuscula TaxID=2022672 RepID=A0A9Q0C1U5_9POAL|nr:hypothetical protein LUZ63_017131 [Rhynchospora breviuscula]
MESQATQKNVVFKVKYGDNLKRINGTVECQQLDLNLAQLTSKIRECFKITPDKDVNLTYVDEDGDTVLLGDDADLFDAAIKQGLNPLRIDIKLKRSPSKNPPEKINSDHNHEVESLGKDVNQKVKITSVKKSSATSDKPSDNSSKQAQVEPTLKHGKPDWSSVSGSSAHLHVSGNAFVGERFALASSPITIGQVEPLPLHHGVECRKCGMNPIVGTYYKSNSEENCKYCVRCSFLQDAKQANYSEIQADGAQRKRSIKQAQASAVPPCPKRYEFPRPLVPVSRVTALLNKTHKQFDMSAGHCSKPFLKHHGGKCEVCGANPIAGQENYNVCTFCYSRIVISSDDYYPAETMFPSSYDLKVHSNACALFDGTPVAYKDQMDRIKTSLGQRRPLRCLVKDVTIPVGTRLEPNTSFRKIWAIKNNGTVKWPYGIILRKSCSSDGFDTPWDVKLEIPLDGLAVNESISISLDLKAPSFPGSYSAWYLLVVPTGIELKELFSVHIDVVSKPSAPKNATAINVNPGSLGSIASTETNTIDVKPTANTEIPEVVAKSKVPMASPTINLDKEMVIVDGDDDLEEMIAEELVEMGYSDEDLKHKALKLKNYALGLARTVVDCSGDPLSDDSLL